MGKDPPAPPVTNPPLFGNPVRRVPSLTKEPEHFMLKPFHFLSSMLSAKLKSKKRAVRHSMPSITKGMTNIDGTKTGKKLAAYLSRPETAEKRPCVIVIHEWWGLVPHIKDVADRYASQGYVTIAPDLYGGAVTTNREEAAKLSSSVSQQSSTLMIKETLQYLERSNFAKSNRIGITGFCFGGTHSFHFACTSDKIEAGVIYYATRIPSEELLSKASAPLLIIYGDQDHSVKPEQARQLESTLKRLGKQAELLMYPGCPHAFFNDENPQSYRREAAKDALEKSNEPGFCLTVPIHRTKKPQPQV
jgi:carboxymethylenebutenolidase